MKVNKQENRVNSVSRTNLWDFQVGSVRSTHKVMRLSRLFDLVEEHILDKYMKDAEREALKLDNRGPLRFGVDGRLDTGIAEAFSEYGFYVFENVIKPVELEDLRDDIARALGDTPTIHKVDFDLHPTR